MTGEYPVWRTGIVIVVTFWLLFLVVCVTSNINPVDAVLVWFK